MQGWTLWNPSNLPSVLREKISQLKVIDKFARKCPCGKEKCKLLNAIKVDASQFFKNADVLRAQKKARDFSTELKK